MTVAHWIRLSPLCRCKWTRKSQVSYRNASEQYSLFWKDKRVYCVYTKIVSTKDVPRRTKKQLEKLSTKSRFLGMHKILVPGALFWVPALGPGPSSACTRVLCMHKSVVHAQDSCACTRNLDHDLDHDEAFSQSLLFSCFCKLPMTISQSQ